MKKWLLILVACIMVITAGCSMEPPNGQRILAIKVEIKLLKLDSLFQL